MRENRTSGSMRRGEKRSDGPLGEWTPDPKGRKRWGAAGPGHHRAGPSLYHFLTRPRIHIIPFEKTYVVGFLMVSPLDRAATADNEIMSRVFNSFHILGERPVQ
jgi:hypothetical protein